MFHRFETEKALQAAGVLLRAHRSRQMSALRLAKLLYFADRENLKVAARPIIGNHVVADQNGPAHREIMEILRDRSSEVTSWTSFIQQDGYVVELIDDPGVLELSAEEIEVLSAVAAGNRTQNDLELVELSRTFFEWRKNYLAQSIRPIPLVDILEAVGWSAEDRAAILEEFDDEDRLERLLKRKYVAAGP